MSGVRDHLLLFFAAMIVGIVALAVVGFGTWSSWLQAGALAGLMVICSRLLAPVYFGWREPDERPRQ
jgi:membrane protein implicated in regulation of membrane protease activity